MPKRTTSSLPRPRVCAHRTGTHTFCNSMRRTPVIVIAALALALLAGCIGPPFPPPSGGSSTTIPCSESNDDHEITTNTDLDPACTYAGHFRVASGGVRLDCHGARITRTDGTGIEVSTPADVTMVGVRVQNCDTDGFLNGIRVTRTMRATTPSSWARSGAPRISSGLSPA